MNGNRLKMSPVGSHLGGGVERTNKFHGGQFSWGTENGKQEHHLVATLGKFRVLWNFQQSVHAQNFAVTESPDAILVVVMSTTVSSFSISNRR
ncbi:hypothetical protein IFM89_031233 [Coptis chinensis]|uniref:Uncharacterized protein n=1 Tax=Coptis chinensis TaxID=261450 RepID=A0A835INW5_9MAGN|nr:hypothetical protein IFM89_031233 [Coptis chinensis]